MSASPHAGQIIAAERKVAGLSQRQLADRANYSLAMVKAVEQGREPASPAFLAAAARALRVEPERLTGTPYRDLAMPGESDLYGTLFGPANVGIHSVAVALEAGDPDRAAREGSSLVLPEEIAPPRAGHHWQDVSRAWLMIGKPDQALAALNRARWVAPQQTRLHPSVRETVYGIAAAQRRQTNSLTGFASWLGVRL